MAVAGRVEHATSCQLQLLSSQSFPVVYSHDPKGCTSGAYAAHVTVGPNTTPVPRTVALALVARNNASASSGRFYVLLAAAPPAVVASVAATPASLPATGGTVAVSGRVEHATSCQLQLLSSQSFPVVYSHDPKGCTSGAYAAHVTVGPNTTPVMRTVAFALVVNGRASASTIRFYVVVGPAGQAGTGTPPTTTTAPTTTTVPSSAVPATTTVPSSTAPKTSVTTGQSSNWSGYVTTGGPYTVAKGSFTVPSVAAGTAGNAQVSEWVGVDGASSSDTSLIQAGVYESPDPANPAGFDVQAWWEILPAAETDITTVAVKAGDTVSVTLWELTATTWEINLTDVTNGQSFTTPPEQYRGPGSSAEWVVEAAAQCGFRCHLSPLAPYSPAVAFSDLGMTGPERSLEEITMVQGTNVATPSALTADRFSVAYTGGQLSGSGLARSNGDLMVAKQVRRAERWSHS